MAIKRILWYPDPLLNERCAPVGDAIDDLETLYRDLSDTMFAHNGAGLAAPQIGVLKRVFVIDPLVAGLGEQDGPLLFVDPEIEWLSDETEVNDEGCLSFPGIYVPIRRSMRARAKARNVRGESFEVEGEGLFARAMQHEKDHLDGTLITDHVGRLKRKMIRRKMEREGRSRDD